MAPTTPYNPLALVSNQNTGNPSRWFPVTKHNTNNNVDNGNIMGCWLFNNATAANTAVIQDEHGVQRTLAIPASTYLPVVFRRLLLTGTGGTTWFAGIPHLNRRPPNDVLVRPPKGVPVLDHSNSDTHKITLSEVFGDFWTFGYTAVSSTTAAATVAIAAGVLTITTAGAGSTNVTVTADWFAGRDSIVLPVTVVA